MKKLLFLFLIPIITNTTFCQEVINVPGNYNSIQLALMNASVNDTVLVQPGTYKENIIWPETSGIKLISAGDTSNTIIDGQSTARVINIIYSIIDTNTVIKGFKLINGYTTGKGAGIQIYNAGLKLDAVSIQNCNANEMAGGIYATGGSLVISNSSIIANTSNYIGGIRSENNYTCMLKSEIKGNISTGDNRTNINAGGVSITSSMYLIKDCFFYNNHSNSYGGGLSVNGTGLVLKCDFTQNSTGSDDWHYGSALSIGANGVADSINVYNNGGSQGGAVCLHGYTNIVLKNSIIKDNFSRGIGVLYGGSATILNTKVIGNPIGIQIGRDQSSNVIINNCLIQRRKKILDPQYEYMFPSYGIFLTSGSAVNLNNSEISGYNYGIFENSSNENVKIKNCILKENQVSLNNKSTTTEIDSTVFTINNTSIRNENGGIVQISNSDIFNNDYGIRNANEAIFVNAENNYWGDPSGAYNPVFNVNGKGDSVDVYVDVIPFKTSMVRTGYLSPLRLKSLKNNKDRSVLVTWDDFNIADIQSINIYYKPVDSITWKIKNTSTMFSETIQNLAVYQMYELKLTYLNSEGKESDNSNTLLVYTDDNRTTFVVPTDDFPTIQGALYSASQYDTVKVMPGIYFESLSWPDSSNITLIGDTINPESTIIDGSGKYQCIKIDKYNYNTSCSKIEGFRIQNGYGDNFGGGLYINRRYLTVDISNCIFINNHAKIGSAINFQGDGTYLNVNHVLIYNNKSTDYGAAFYCPAVNVKIYESTIVNNYSENTDLTQAGNGGVFGYRAFIYNSIFWNSGDPNILNYDFYGAPNGNIWLYNSCLNYGENFEEDSPYNRKHHIDGINSFPEFVDTTNNDFRLKPNSPCIDAGNPLKIAGNCTRIDMGYYESEYGQRINYSSTNLSICSGDSLYWKGNYYSKTGKYLHELNTGIACDSIYELNLSINPTYFIQVSSTICNGDSILWQNNYYSTEGSYYKNYSTINGCDSIYKLELIVNPVYHIEEKLSICKGDSILWQNSFYKEEGTYITTYSTINGCDSIYALSLTINPVYQDSIEETICEGDIFNFGSQSLTIAGEYTHVFQSESSCDSTVVLTLKVNPTYHKTINETICEGDIFTFGSQSLTFAGEYTEVFQSELGCDSTVALTLNVNPIYHQTINETICEGEEYTFGNQLLTQTGEYEGSFNSINGCDSVVTLKLTVNSVVTGVTQDGKVLSAIATDASYQWATCGNTISLIVGETEKTFTASKNGSYAVIVEQNSCIDTSDCYSITGISILENGFLQEFDIYPNPTDGEISFDTKTDFDKIDVLIINEMGQTIGKEIFKNTHLIKIDLSARPSGNYKIVLISGEQKACYQVIKN
jgi:hypothetical protein